MNRVVLLVAVAAACATAAGCGGSRSSKQPPPAVQRAVAGRFAQAILHGDTAAATALLAHAEDAALVARAASRWRAHPAALHLPGTPAGKWWTFRYTATRTQPGGRFERLRGEVVVLVGQSARGAAVELFALPNEHVRFSTHHDSVLLPSNR